MKSTGCVVALGNFDGVHKGHQKVVSTAVSIAKENGFVPIVYNFNKNTKSYFSSDILPVITNDQKTKILKRLGILDVIYADFEKIKDKDAKSFVKEELIDKLNAKILVCGNNYHLGKGGKTDANCLKKICDELKISLKVVDDVKVFDTLASSSNIRKFLSEGNIERVNDILGYNYYLTGKITHGKKLASKMGIPTINFDYDNSLVLMKKGVYITQTVIDSKKYKSITNIGVCPTVNKNKITVESHLIDFDSDAYGKEVKVIFYKMTREEKKFNNKEELFDQIKCDIESLKNYSW